MERPFQEIRGIRQWRPSLAPYARERKRCWLRWPMHHHPDPHRHGQSSALGDTDAHAAPFPHHCGMIRARRCRTPATRRRPNVLRSCGRSASPGLSMSARRVRAQRSYPRWRRCDGDWDRLLGSLAAAGRSRNGRRRLCVNGWSRMAETRP